MPSPPVALLKSTFGVLAWLMLLPLPTGARAATGDAQTAWRLLDYVAVD